MRYGSIALALILASLFVAARDRLAVPAAVPTGPVAVAPVLSPPLRSLASVAPEVSSRDRRLVENYRVPQRDVPTPLQLPDPVVQDTPGPAAPTAVGVNFDGIPVSNSAPPDTNGRVGRNHYVQWVNTQLAIWDKAGNPLFGPIKGNLLFESLGGTCFLHNDGDPIVQYDLMADRWILSQFAVNATDGNASHECVAVSKTGDPLGEYYLYDFVTHQTTFVDYPHWGVWTDGYYMTTHQFGSSVTQGLYVFERDAMLAGAPARLQLVDLGGSLGALPSDLDSLAPPPAGAPNYVMTFGSSVQDGTNGFVLHLWKAKATWGDTPTFDVQGPIDIAVQPFQANACPDTFAPGLLGRPCVIEPGPEATQQDWLDVISDRLMYRLAYRHFPSGTTADPTPREVLVLNHTVALGAQLTGIRWYELRNPNGTPTIFQQGTYAPADGDSRWMGSIAMDNAGDILLGYSRSGLITFPSLHVAGREPGDAAGTLGAELPLVAGLGSQIGTGNRWGDYSAMTVDPYDGCTFWFTSEYLPATGQFNWKTRIGTYRFPSCGPEPQAVIEGIITDCGSGTPLSRVLVRTDSGFSATTGDDGRYSMIVPPGTHVLTAGSQDRACGASSASSVTVANGATASRDFCISGDPILELTGTSVDDAAGNGNGVINRDECVQAGMDIFNRGCAVAQDVKGVLSTSTPGVTIAQALAPFPDVAVDASASSQSPYGITVGPDFVCGTPIALDVSLRSATTEETRHFELPTCQAASVIRTGALTANDATHPNRMGRDSSGTTCTAVKACPGAIETLPDGSPDPTSPTRVYDSYPFKNEASTGICVKVNLTADAGCSGTNQIQSVAYRGSFDPDDLCANYLGDSGSSPDVGFNTYYFKVAAGEDFVVNVNAVQNGGLCSGYQLKVDGFIDSATTGGGGCGDHPSAPVAVADAASTTEGTAVVIPVLANDATGGFPPLSVLGVTTPARGTAVVNGDGTVTYTPDPDFVTGTDAFDYTIANAQNRTDAATVTVTVDSLCDITPAGDAAFTFDAGDEGWTVDTVDDVGSVTWARTGGEFFTQDPLVGPKDDRLISPVVNLSPTSQLQLSHRFNTEDTFDGGVLEVSLDGGANWQEITAAGGVFLQGGYNSSASGAPAAWSGISADYPANEPVVVDLAALAGLNRRFRFRFTADGNTGTEGWYIDSVTITNTLGVTCTPNTAPTASAGADFAVDEGAGALLSGAGSSDPENDTLTYAWTQVGTPAVTLSGADTAAASFTAPAVDVDTPLVFQLKVTDTGGLESTDLVAVTVRNVGGTTVDLGDNRAGGALPPPTLLLLGFATVRRRWRGQGKPRLAEPGFTGIARPEG